MLFWPMQMGVETLNSNRLGDRRNPRTLRHTLPTHVVVCAVEPDSKDSHKGSIA